MKVRPGALDSILDHARRSLPRECCGVLLSAGDESRVVREAIPALNVSEEPTRRYALGPRAHLRAVEMELRGDARIAGYYHSHPDGGCRPSQWDIDQAVPGVRYLIVGLAGGTAECGAWRMEAGRVVSEPVEASE
ncbi:hypothetical protein LCGC14_1364540 [marine sediment metagenome]|uniref:MPN domain-containing protein n=1 Tax=marine sediment metagenome TaxID=412755 RepID=A0A0F9KT86_9ZZZZ